MTWHRLKSSVRNLLQSRDLKEPRIRLGALDNLEKTLKEHFPEIISNPSLMLNYDKVKFKKMLAKHKKNDTLNSAESSIVNNFYQFLTP